MASIKQIKLPNVESPYDISARFDIYDNEIKVSEYATKGNINNINAQIAPISDEEINEICSVLIYAASEVNV